jgi:hypothetical protein
MKKLALIILMAVYGLAIAGAGIAPVITDEHGCCTHANEISSPTNESSTGSCSSATCNAGYTAFTVKEHQHAARQFHFSTRHFIRDTEGNFPEAAPSIPPASFFACNTRVTGSVVPAYILHCVYRL